MTTPINPFVQRDAANVKTVSPKAAGTAGTEYSAPIDLGVCEVPGVRGGDYELLIEAPELTATAFPSSATLKLVLQSSNDANFSAVTTTQTLADLTGGAKGAGSYRVKHTADAARYWRIGVTSNASTGTGIADAVFKIGPAF